MIRSDWHIHSEYSYDAHTLLENIAKGAEAQGLLFAGITDHANFNDEKFLGDLRASAENVKIMQKKYPRLVLGVELTPIAKPEFDYIAITGKREGYVPPVPEKPYDIELAASKEELIALGVRYAIGASHWRVDVPDRNNADNSMKNLINEWYRQQMYLACDERVTILGHPWYNGRAVWYEDFSVIPHSMNMDIAAALLENGKYAECNPCMLTDPRQTEKFKMQYAEFLRELFEMGIPITYGSDCHGAEGGEYPDVRGGVVEILEKVGFGKGDFSELSEADLW
jgi:histidinol phosphatase-like PHP family hydrolase